MKRIKFKPNKKVEDIAEICKLASNYFYIFTSLYNETCEIELQDLDSNVDEARTPYDYTCQVESQKKQQAAKASVEKLMVDVAVDEDFISIQDYESLRFYRNVIDICTINETKLLRYATRRGCKDKIKNILDTAKQNEIID